MEFDIKELTITFMVGAFTILGTEAILKYLVPVEWKVPRFKYLFAKGKSDHKNSSKPEHTPSQNSEKEQPITVVLFIVIAFGLGIFAEDLSQKFVYDNWLFYASATHFFNLPSEGDDRAISLINSFKKPQPEQLATDLATNGAFCISDTPGIGKKFQEWILMDPRNRCAPKKEESAEGCPSQKEIETSAANLYYYAKNTAFTYHDSYDELKNIQDRIELVRSISVIAFLFALLAIALCIVNFKRYRKTERMRWHALITFGIFCAISLASIWAYARESDAFNKRAYGYLSTMLISEKRQRLQNSPCEKEGTVPSKGQPQRDKRIKP